jgi:hypothetical protein
MCRPLLGHHQALQENYPYYDHSTSMDPYEDNSRNSSSFLVTPGDNLANVETCDSDKTVSIYIFI